SNGCHDSSNIAVSGNVTNTGTNTLFAITVTNTPSGGTPYVIPAGDYAATTSSGRAYDGSLTNGESITFTNSYAPFGNLCGPFNDTIVACGTDNVGGGAEQVTVCARDSATCFVCTSPRICVTKTCSTNSAEFPSCNLAGVAP